MINPATGGRQWVHGLAPPASKIRSCKSRKRGMKIAARGGVTGFKPTRALERHMVHVLAAGAILLNAVGNSFLRVGLSSDASLTSFAPSAYLAAFANPWVILGVLLLFTWLILQ